MDILGLLQCPLLLLSNESCQESLRMCKMRAWGYYSDYEVTLHLTLIWVQHADSVTRRCKRSAIPEIK